MSVLEGLVESFEKEIIGRLCFKKGSLEEREERLKVFLVIIFRCFFRVGGF